MDYLKNHCWCSDSNWGGHYDCTIIVSLSSYSEGYREDWDSLTCKVDYFDKDVYDSYVARYPERDLADSGLGWKQINKLKPEVMYWLEANVPDNKEGKAWCVGSDEYIARDSGGMSVFFQRRSDAMKFIKTWSKWKKPINYCQYFTDVRKTLDLKTLKYIER